MPIRVFTDGSFLCDTPAEAMAMSELLVGRRSKESRREARRAARGTPTATLSQAVSNNGTTTLAQALLGAAASGISSNDLAAKINVSPRSLPPLMLSFRRKVKAAGHEIDNVLTRERVLDANQKPISMYKLTAEGVRLLGR